MLRSIADRNLIYGMLALRMDFVSPDALIAAREASPLDQHADLGEVLLSRGALDEDDRSLLDSLVSRYVEKHGNDSRRSLAALNLIFPPCVELDPDATMPPPPGASDGLGARYRLIQLHASGGLGEVWIALDEGLKRRVAVKQLRGHRANDPGAQARFLREAEITGRLEHRGIAPVYSLGHFEDGRPFYAMRFLGGVSLKDSIAAFHRGGASGHARADGSLELRRLLGRFVDVCHTIAYAHSRNILHRDLKPGNIVVDEFGETLVVDWGLAKDVRPAVDAAEAGVGTAEEDPSVQTGAVIGTPAYMSPEQASVRPVELGPATDVYSLGATLYCLLTGRPAFAGREPHLVLPVVRRGVFPPPHQVDPLVPIALEAICLKAMALRPEERYASAQELGEDVERWLADRPVEAYPEPPLTRAVRWVRRHVRGVATGAVLAVLGLIALAIHDFQLSLERRKTDEQLKMTRDALRELLQVSGSRLALVPGSENLRESLAELVLKRYRSLGDSFPTDPDVRLETAQVHRVLAGIARVTGAFDKSRDHCEKAIEILRALANFDPARFEYRRWLVEAQIEHGELNHMYSRTFDAEEDFRAALVEAEKLPAQSRASDEQQRARASVLINLSEILLLKDRPDEAFKAADPAVSLLRRLASPRETSGNTTRDIWLLAMALADRAVATMGAGDLAAAFRDLEEAENVAGRVPAQDDVYDDAQFLLATILSQRGSLLGRDPTRLAEADASYGNAIKLFEKLMDAHPLIPQHREEMAASLTGRGTVRLAMTRVEDAQRDCREARKQIESLMKQTASTSRPDNPQYLSVLGRVLALESRIDFARGLVDPGRKARAEAMENLVRAIRIDPARVADEKVLDELRAERQVGQ